MGIIKQYFLTFLNRTDDHRYMYLVHGRIGPFRFVIETDVIVSILNVPIDNIVFGKHMGQVLVEKHVVLNCVSPELPKTFLQNVQHIDDVMIQMVALEPNTKWGESHPSSELTCGCHECGGMRLRMFMVH